MMRYEAIKTVAVAQEDAKQIRSRALAQAEQLIAQAKTEGAARVQQVIDEAKQEVAASIREAEALGAKQAEQIHRDAAADRDAMAKQAELNLEEAVSLIIGRIVNS